MQYRSVRSTSMMGPWRIPKGYAWSLPSPDHGYLMLRSTFYSFTLQSKRRYNTTSTTMAVQVPHLTRIRLLCSQWRRTQTSKFELDCYPSFPAISLTESSTSYSRIISPFFLRMYYQQGCMNWVSGFLVHLLFLSMYGSVARLRSVYVVERCVFIMHGRSVSSPGHCPKQWYEAVLHPLRTVPWIAVHSGFPGFTLPAVQSRSSVMANRVIVTVRATRGDRSFSLGSWRFMNTPPPRPIARRWKLVWKFQLWTQTSQFPKYRCSSATLHTRASICDAYRRGTI